MYCFILFTVLLSASPVEVLSKFLTPMQRIPEKARNLLHMMQCMTGSKCPTVCYDVVCFKSLVQRTTASDFELHCYVTGSRRFIIVITS
jgi:hypothetical protein